MRTYGPLLLCLCLLAGFSGVAIGQAKNNVPDVIPGAPKVTVEHIKVHGASLEGNLEGDAADRDVLVFLPPSYAQRTAVAAIPSSMPCMAIPSAPSNGARKSMCPRRSKAPSPRAPAT